MRNGLAALGSLQDGALQGERTIGDIARTYEVSLRTLRFYEDKGLLQPRRQGTARFYSARDRIRLELILKGKRLGFTLSEIYDLIASRAAAEPDGTDLTVRLGRDKIAAQITHLQRQRDELNAALDELHAAMRRTGDGLS